MLDNLIFDRTAGDLLHWLELRAKGYSNMTDEERAEWDAGNMKGAYNVSDLNRVGAALNYVRDRLATAGYIGAAAFSARTDWALTDIPTAADLKYYLSCVSTIRAAIAVFSTTPAAPMNSGSLDYNEANHIEKILFDIDGIITNMLAARHFCGELYSGEV